MNWQDYISITPGVRSGKPCVKGTRITVSDVLEYLAGGPIARLRVNGSFRDNYSYGPPHPLNDSWRVFAKVLIRIDAGRYATNLASQLVASNQTVEDRTKSVVT